MKLLCDQMLGSLAKWLRILGFDTFYANKEITDEELLNIAKIEKRTIISRDKELILRGKKQNISAIEIQNTDLDDQLELVLNLIEIDEKLVLSRCTLCNKILEKIEKNKVEGKVPKKVFDNNDEFWFCNKCKKFYWTGSHYKKITDKIDGITKRKTKK
ncbi:MAG: Mut7-C RNAse domain-containing protein [Thermoplasmatales archaeon]|nr:MAG: Mut7-C RNAse domain-containing protein [Thermoplasmatales archaeon]